MMIVKLVVTKEMTPLLRLALRHLKVVLTGCLGNLRRSPNAVQPC